MTTTAAKILSAGAARFELEVSIEAPIDDVWQAVIQQPDAWWVSDMRCVSAGSTMHLEPRAGGTLVESDDAGASLLWFTVLAVEPGRSINFEGALAPPFGGPCSTYLLLELETRASLTVVKLTHSLHGHVDEAMLPEMESGWRLLFEGGLKPFVETGTSA